MTDEQSPFLMPVNIVCKSPQIPLGISDLALSKVAKILEHLNQSLFRSRIAIEAVTLSLPGRQDRFLDPASLLFGEFAYASEQANDRVAVACSLATKELSMIKNEVLDQDKVKIDLLLTELEFYRINIFFIELTDKPYVSAGSILGKIS